MPSEPVQPASADLRDQFAGALRGGDVGRVRALLEEHAGARALVNAPLGPFGGRPIHMAGKNLAMLDTLIAHGADVNLKSDWWAGGFGIFESSMTSGEAAALIARGAVVDVFGAANLGMPDRVREMVEADPSLVHARPRELGGAPLGRVPRQRGAREEAAAARSTAQRARPDVRRPAARPVPLWSAAQLAVQARGLSGDGQAAARGRREGEG
jgi:hypothetical protein